MNVTYSKIDDFSVFVYCLFQEDPAIQKKVKSDLLIFVELANALKHTPPRLEDAVVSESLSQIGFKDNIRFLMTRP